MLQRAVGAPPTQVQLSYSPPNAAPSSGSSSGSGAASWGASFATGAFAVLVSASGASSASANTLGFSVRGAELISAGSNFGISPAVITSGSIELLAVPLMPP